tara:strand:- start:627 stop:815 length:189 start_codon:yes stop_codon:yes gene_type:complete
MVVEFIILGYKMGLLSGVGSFLASFGVTKYYLIKRDERITEGLIDMDKKVNHLKVKSNDYFK